MFQTKQGKLEKKAFLQTEYLKAQKTTTPSDVTRLFHLELSNDSLTQRGSTHRFTLAISTMPFFNKTSVKGLTQQVGSCFCYSLS